MSPQPLLPLSVGLPWLIEKYWIEAINGKWAFTHGSSNGDGYGDDGGGGSVGIDDKTPEKRSWVKLRGGRVTEWVKDGQDRHIHCQTRWRIEKAKKKKKWADHQMGNTINKQRTRLFKELASSKLSWTICGRQEIHKNTQKYTLAALLEKARKSQAWQMITLPRDNGFFRHHNSDLQKSMQKATCTITAYSYSFFEGKPSNSIIYLPSGAS